MLIDTHAHINFNAYKDDVEAVIRRSLDNEVWMINVGSQYNTSKRAVEIAEKYPTGVFAAVGLHPIHLAGGTFKTPKQSLRDATGQTKIDPAELSSATHGAGTEEISFKTREEEFDYEKYKDLALRSLGEGGKVVAIGEIGLDYYYKPKTTARLAAFKEKQKEVFLKQLDLAQELNLPVIFHCRFAHDDLITILNTKYQILNTKLQGVIHCFTGNQEQAEKYLKMGFYLGFNGIIFKFDCEKVIKNTPLEKILVETDCPYLMPPLPAEALLARRNFNESGAKEGPPPYRNEPSYLKYIIEKIAKIKNISYEKVAEITTENAKTLFKI